MPSTVYLRRADRTDPLPTVRELLDRCGWQELVRPGASVMIKPNLCTERPEMIPCANTSLSVLRAVCQVHSRTDRERDDRRVGRRAVPGRGGVRKHRRLLDGRALGCKVLNLSKDTLVDVPDARMAGFGMSKAWLEADVFITLPVLKTHATTVFTGALKNQWGCIPRYDRIMLHKHLHELIVEVNRLRPVTLALMDGLVGMQGRGPINGYPIDLNVLLASRDPVALDATGMRLIGLDPLTSQHSFTPRHRSGPPRRRTDHRRRTVRRSLCHGRAGGRGLGDQTDEPGLSVAVPDAEPASQRRGFLPHPPGGEGDPRRVSARA